MHIGDFEKRISGIDSSTERKNIRTGFLFRKRTLKM